MKTLVTGATGFVGAAVTRALVRRGHDVRVLVRPHSDRRNLEALDVEPVTGDLRDPPSLRRALAGCGALFHVAADYRLWARDPSEIVEVNVAGTRNLLTAAADQGIARVVYTSSVAALGVSHDGTPSTEDSHARPEDLVCAYKRSKVLAEKEAMAFVARERLPVVIVNPSTPVGPGDVRPTPTGRMIREAALGRMPAFVDTGLNIVHVDDVGTGHVLAFEKGRIGERYILGGTDLTLAEILATIAELTGRRPPRIRLPHAAVLPVAWLSELWASLVTDREPLTTVAGVRLSRHSMFFSSAKAERELGYHARPAQEALADAVAWFLGWQSRYGNARETPPTALRRCS